MIRAGSRVSAGASRYKPHRSGHHLTQRRVRGPQRYDPGDRVHEGRVRRGLAVV